MLNEKDIKKRMKPKPRGIKVNWTYPKKYKMVTVLKSDGTVIFDIETEAVVPSMENPPRKITHG